MKKYLTFMLLLLIGLTAAASRCNRCGGAGRIQTRYATSGYGVNNSKIKCNYCGQWIFANENHWDPCPSCNGSPQGSSDSRHSHSGSDDDPAAVYLSPAEYADYQYCIGVMMRGTTEIVDCPDCGGTGYCRVCQGTGNSQFQPNSAYETGIMTPCEYCGGTKYCRKCSGLGTVQQNSGQGKAEAQARVQEYNQIIQQRRNGGSGSYVNTAGSGSSGGGNYGGGGSYGGSNDYSSSGYSGVVDNGTSYNDFGKSGIFINEDSSSRYDRDDSDSSVVTTLLILLLIGGLGYGFYYYKKRGWGRSTASHRGLPSPKPSSPKSGFNLLGSKTSEPKVEKTRPEHRESKPKILEHKAEETKTSTAGLPVKSGATVSVAKADTPSLPVKSGAQTVQIPVRKPVDTDKPAVVVPKKPVIPTKSR